MIFGFIARAKAREVSPSDRLNIGLMAKKLKDYNSEVLSKFRKKMAAVQRAEIRQNRYTLGKIVGKLNVFNESEEDGGDPKTTRINGCGLTRLKDSDGMYAIGDSDGKQLTDFDFVYVSTDCLGEEEPVIEVITKSGKNKYFVVKTGETEN